MRLLVLIAGAALLAAHGARADDARLQEPTVQGQPVDHCAEINAENDCSENGAAKAATRICTDNGYTEQTGSHWRPASGTAMHYIVEYDMHAGEVGGRWMAKPTTGTFDWITCKK
jgi:hypothetical protein